VYICFLVALAMMAASPIRAAESATSPSREFSEHRTVVVRADPRTGRLVRTVVIAPRPVAIAPASGDGSISDLVDRAARANDVDPLLVHSMIKVESNYNPRATSPKGAEGLMQLMPSTARMLGVANSFDPQQNIEAGVKYLKYLQGVYKDDRLALAAYNAGPGAVEKYKWIPPYPETQNYVNQVNKHYGEARREAAKAAAPAPPVETVAVRPVPIADVPVEEQHPRLEKFIDENGRLHLRTLQ
jgi:soluble lytic murein transglycosylase-like protein